MTAALGLVGGLALATNQTAGAVTSSSCSAASLTASIPAKTPFVRGVMGTSLWTLKLTNHTDAACSVSGWPTLTVKSANTGTWSSAAAKVTATQTIATPAVAVPLAPGQSAAVIISEPAVGSACSSDWRLSAALDSGGSPLVLDVPATLLGHCPVGTALSVSRLVPLASAAAEPATSATITASTKTAQCVMPNLTARELPAVPSASKTLLTFQLTNAGAPCSLPFWMESRVRSSAGASSLATFVNDANAQSTLSSQFESTEGAPSVLPAGGSIQLPLSVSTAGTACSTASTVTLYDSVSDLGSSRTVTLTNPIRSCGRPAVFPLVRSQPAATGQAADALSPQLRSAFAVLADTSSAKPLETGGFAYGTDSNSPTVAGSTAPYLEPQAGSTVVAGHYGFYSGAIDSYWRDNGCTGAPQYSLAFNSKNKAAADADLDGGFGFGADPYFAVGGPGLDEQYGTAAEATSWGSRQAATLVSKLSNDFWGGSTVYLDIEDVVNGGWNAAWSTRCGGYGGGSKTASSIPSIDDINTYHGVTTYVQAHTGYTLGIYMAGGAGGGSWNGVFGSYTTGASEWTYENETSNSHTFPTGFSVPGVVSAVFFAGATTSSSNACAWQWSGGGGTSNGYGDLDQVRC